MNTIWPDIWQFMILHWRGLLGWVWLIAGIALAIYITLQRRSPASTLAWILALLLISPMGLVIYRFFGPQKVQRQSMRRLRSRRRFQARYGSIYRQFVKNFAPLQWAMQHSRLIETSCGIPLSSCQSVQLLNGGGATLHALLQQIEQAQQHVHLEYYIYEPDQSGTLLMDALIAALQRGVTVRLLVDGVGSFAFLRRKGRHLRAQFAQAGGQLAVFHPTHLGGMARPMLNLRTHRKIVVCDGVVGFTGGINITDAENEQLFPGHAYRDTHLRLQGAAVQWLQYVFLEDWAYASGQHEFEPGVFVEQMAPGPYPVHVTVSGPDSDGQAIHHSMLHAINSARQRILLTTPYFVPTEPAWYALFNAVLRGVQVRLLVPRRSDSFWVTMAARSYFDALCQAGVEVYEYAGPLLHAKTLVVDDQYGMVGSANFDNRSFLLNFETNVVVYSATFNQELADMFEQDLRHATRVARKPQDIRWYQKLAEACARLFSPLL